MDTISSSTTKPPTSNAKFFAVDSSSSDDDSHDINSNFEYEPLPEDKRVNENSASIHLTKIPLIAKIMTFASLTPVSPLEFAQVHSSWNDAVRFFNAVSHVWSALFSESYLAHPLHHPRLPSSTNDEYLPAENNDTQKRDSITMMRKQYDMKMEAKKYLVPLIRYKKPCPGFLRENDNSIFINIDLETDRRNRTLLWYFEKVLDAGIDDELFHLNPIENHGTCLHIALRDQNLGALELICDAIVNRPRNRKNAKVIFNLSSTVPCFYTSRTQPEVAESSKVGQPIFACFPGEHNRSNPASFAKLLQYAPEFVDVNAVYDGPQTKTGVHQKLHETVLHLICARAKLSNFIECAKHLIPLADKVGLDVNIVRSSTSSAPRAALSLACHAGNEKIVDMLLNELPPKAHSELELAPNIAGTTNAVMSAVIGNHAACLKLLFDDSRVDFDQLWHMASRAGLLQRTAASIKDYDRDCERALECMRLLIDVAKFDVNHIDPTSSYSALAAAVHAGNKKAAKLLISRGADLNWSSTRHANLIHLITPRKEKFLTKHQEIIDELLTPNNATAVTGRGGGGAVSSLFRNFFGGNKE